MRKRNKKTAVRRKKSKVNPQRLKPDVVMKEYWSGNSEFADLFNTLIYGGEHHIDESDLCEQDTESSMIIANGTDAKDVGKGKYLTGARDMIKIAKNALGVEYVLLGLENQEGIHYALPFKVLKYDAYSYDKQYRLKKAEYRNKDGKVTLTGDELISGIRKEDRFLPVVTVTLYYGEKPWDGPRELYDILNIPEELKEYVPNYRLNIVEVCNNNLIFNNQNNRDLFSLLSIICNPELTIGEKRTRVGNYEKEHNVDSKVARAVTATSNISIKGYKEETKVYTVWEEIRKEGEKHGKEIGEMVKLINQVCKKIGRYTVSDIADMLEEDEQTIACIIEHAKKYEPDYEAHAEDIYNDMNN